jgi:hypothetical protein
MIIQPTQHEKHEWSRFATVLYSKRLNAFAHKFSAAAALPRNAEIDLKLFDQLQQMYRAWLVFDEYPESV